MKKKTYNLVCLICFFLLAFPILKISALISNYNYMNRHLTKRAPPTRFAHESINIFKLNAAKKDEETMRLLETELIW